MNLDVFIGKIWLRKMLFAEKTLLWESILTMFFGFVKKERA